MMDVKKIASLARLALSSDEEAKFQQQLSGVIKYFEQLAQVPTENVEPLVTPTEIEQHWREDKGEKVLEPEEALANAPERSGNLFKVPPVV